MCLFIHLADAFIQSNFTRKANSLFAHRAEQVKANSRAQGLTEHADIHTHILPVTHTASALQKCSNIFNLISIHHFSRLCVITRQENIPPSGWSTENLFTQKSFRMNVQGQRLTPSLNIYMKYIFFLNHFHELFSRACAVFINTV